MIKPVVIVLSSILILGCGKITKFDMRKAEKACGEIENITWMYKDGDSIIVKCDSKESSEVIK